MIFLYIGMRPKIHHWIVLLVNTGFMPKISQMTDLQDPVVT